jgi:hypothetical protein
LIKGFSSTVLNGFKTVIGGSSATGSIDLSSSYQADSKILKGH